MQLGSNQGPSVELKVLGYEFPRAGGRKNSWDANWLNIAGRIRLADGRTWEFTHPCLDTFEAAQLGSWLQRLSDGDDQPPSLRHGRPSGAKLVFTEPLLAFEAETTSHDDLIIRIILDLEALPAWKPWERWDGEDQFVVAVPVKRHELHVVAHQWAHELASFPPR